LRQAPEQGWEDDSTGALTNTAYATYENKVTKTKKDHDLKYKTAEVNSLAKAVAESG